MAERLIICLSIMVSVSLTASATHIVGGEIFYKCLGDNEYLITLKVYRDCLNGEAPFDDPANIAVYNSSGGLVTNLLAPFQGSDLLEVVISNPCLQAPPDICVEEAVYTVQVSLTPVSGGYHVAYQRCCRNQSIVNIIDPGAQGSTYYVTIPEEALNSCNSSPYFNNFPPLALCIGDELVFDHSATDPDGDQIVYSLCTPFHGGSQALPAPSPPDAPPYTMINWGGGYSSGYPIDADPQLSIDPVTGILTGVPTQAGQYVVGVCAEEFRDGQLLSTNKRDFQFNVVNCSSNVVAAIPPQEILNDLCSGLGVSFGNSSVNAQFYFWDFGVAATSGDTSVLEYPTYIFPDTGIYQVMLIANPGYACADTAYSNVTVYDPIVAEIQDEEGQCFDVNSFDFEAGGQFGSAATFFWEFENGQPSTSTDMNPAGIVFDSLGSSQVTLTITENTCSDQTQTDIVTHPRPDAYFSPEFFSGCNPLTISLHDSSYSGTERQVLWDFGDGHTSWNPNPSHTYTVPGTYSLSLTVWTTEACIDTSAFAVPNAVTVYPLPSGTLAAEPDTQSIFEPLFQFSGASNDALNCALAPGTSDTLWAAIQFCEFEYLYPDTGDFYPVMIFTNQYGCTMTDTARVRVEPEVRFWLPNAFTPNDNRLNDRWGPSNMGWREYELWVFDRWGQLVFHTTDPDDWWNGRINNDGNLVPVPGVYAYRIEARSVKRKILSRIGHVTLVK